MFEDSDTQEFSDDWPDQDEENLVVPCPNCGVQVYEDAEQCPACGEFIVHSTSAWSDKPAWWTLMGIAGIIAVILILSGLVL